MTDNQRISDERVVNVRDRLRMVVLDAAVNGVGTLSAASLDADIEWLCGHARDLLLARARIAEQEHKAREQAAEIERLRKILEDALSRLPVGNLRTHTIETVPDRIEAFADGLAEERDEARAERDAFAGCHADWHAADEKMTNASVPVASFVTRVQWLIDQWLAIDQNRCELVDERDALRTKLAELTSEVQRLQRCTKLTYMRDGAILMAVQNGIDFADDAMPEDLETGLRAYDCERDTLLDENEKLRAELAALKASAPKETP